MARLISACHAECVQSFEEALATIRNPSHNLTGPRLSSIVQNESSRYNVWAGNVGAPHHGRTYRLSLDYRLKDASFYRDRVVELLLDLESTLQKVTLILQGKRIPFERQQVPSEPDLASLSSSQGGDSSDNSSSSDSTDSDHEQGLNLRNIQAIVAGIERKPTITLSHPFQPGEQEHEVPPATEMGQLQEAVIDIVSSLFKIAKVIRRPLPSDRHTQSTKVDVQHFAEFDRRYIDDKFPYADEKIRDRLSKGINRRRQLLKYRELHQQKLQLSFPNPKSSNVDTTTNYIAQTDRETSTNKQPIPQPTTSKAESSELNPSTRATAFVPGVAMAMEEIQSVADTTSSYQSTSLGHEVIRIPPRPKGVDGDELGEFECPYCHVLCMIGNEKAWKQHVLKDLEPYMCTFTQCSNPDVMYSSRLDWQEHELEEHRMEWFCNVTGHKCYQNRADFDAHMLESHSSSLSSGQLTSLLHSFRRPLQTGEHICPLCLKTTQRIESHLARHHTQIALFAIPRINYGDGESKAGSDNSRLAAGHSEYTDSLSTLSITNSLERIQLEESRDEEVSDQGSQASGDLKTTYAHSDSDSDSEKVWEGGSYASLDPKDALSVKGMSVSSSKNGSMQSAIRFKTGVDPWHGEASNDNLPNSAARYRIFIREFAKHTNKVQYFYTGIGHTWVDVEAKAAQVVKLYNPKDFELTGFFPHIESTVVGPLSVEGSSHEGCHTYAKMFSRFLTTSLSSTFRVREAERSRPTPTSLKQQKISTLQS
ncbi:hypothetical protein B0J14DRAFT_296811 [Halenospora varia]|nr:hypothetical protein B0J14DRAFT_296811 [Halenospora varia]